MSARRSLRVAVAVVVLLVVVVALLWHRPGITPHPGPRPFPWAMLDRDLRMAWAGSLGGDGARGASMGRQGSTPVRAIGVCGMRDEPLADDSGDDADAATSAPASATSATSAAAAPLSSPALRQMPRPTPAEQRILDAMRQSPDAFAQAATLVLGPSGDPDDPLERQERLAAAALRTSDPRIYALAYTVCAPSAASSPAGTCALLTTAQWARLDSANGMPWLYALSDAVPRGDVAARDDALFHLSVAQHIDDHFFDIPASVTEQAPLGDDATAMMALMLSVRGSAAMASPPFQMLIDLCKGPQLDDSNRHQLCASVADALINHGSSLIVQSIGASIDTSVTGSAVRANRLRAERDALLTQPDLDFSCNGLRRRQHRLQRSAQIGELAAWREARPATPP